jgi:hypothetical protein
VSPPLPDDLPVQVEGDEILVGCGGASGWAPSVMASGVPGVVSDAEMTATFQQILGDPEYGAEAELSLFANGAENVEWRVLRHTDNELTMGLGTWTDQGPVDGAMVLGLRREADRWIPDGWGDCQLAPILDPGHTWAHVAKSETTVDRGTSTIPVRVSEGGCTGSRDSLPPSRNPSSSRMEGRSRCTGPAPR